MKKILYIYGLGGSPYGSTIRNLKKILTNYEILSFEYSQNDCGKAREEIVEYIKAKKIDLIIGSSLGGFITLTLQGYNRFVINPCWRPSEELPKFGVDDSIIATYIPYEPLLKHCQADADLVRGFFGDEDELFGDKYHEDFIKCFKHLTLVKSKHHASAECIYDIHDYLPQYWKDIEQHAIS